LTSYLQKLHEAKLANANHTTLLLNCYTKLKEVQKLDDFIKTPELNFDVETAIKVCRQAGYHEHALDLARRHREHKWFLKVLLEDLHLPSQALEYIQTLPFDAAEENLQKYGKILVNDLPGETTTLLKELCTNYIPKEPKEDTPKSTSDDLTERDLLGQKGKNQSSSKLTEQKKAVAEKFIHIYVNQPEWLTDFLEYIIQKGQGSPLIYDTLLELYLRDTSDDELLKVKSSEYETSPAPQESQEVKESKRKMNLEKALTLLKDHQGGYNEGHALVLCQIQDFKLGILYLYEKMELFNEILQYHMDNDEYTLIIKACKKYGDKDSKGYNLWVKALSYFANKDPANDTNKEIPALIQEVLSNIEKVPPLQVIQILSQSPTATLGMIKDYITRNLQREQRKIEEDARQISRSMEETQKNKSEIQELKTGVKIFQHMKCSACNLPLDLPAVHFLCMHSFHQRCLGDNESECPNCAEENRNFENLQRSLIEGAQQHNEFTRQLESSPDGFSIVAMYYGRGLFDKPALANLNIPEQKLNLDTPIHLH